MSRLLEDVVSDGREFNAVLVWGYSRLSLNGARFAEIKRTLSEHGVSLVSADGSPRLIAWERPLAVLAGALDDEAAG